MSNLWTDIMNGKFNLDLPNGTIISRYSTVNDESKQLRPERHGREEGHRRTAGSRSEEGAFPRLPRETDDGDVAAATELAWQRVWNDTQSGELKRAPWITGRRGRAVQTTCTVYIALP